MHHQCVDSKRRINIRIRKKVLSLIIAIVMIGTMMFPIGLVCPVNAATETSSTTWTKLNSSTAGQSIGTNGQTKYYYISSNVSCTNTNNCGSGLTINGGATVYIYIPSGCTLTCTGKPSVGTTGGGAGILLPSNSKLYLIGSGKVKATGGNATMGAAGESGISSSYNATWDAISTSGAGGNGGGGAGAGIGTAGGTGGTGGSRQTRTQHIADITEYTGTNGNNGASGASANDAGTLYVSGVDISDVKGGQAALKNTSTVNYSGTARQWYNYTGSQTQWKGEQYYYVGGAGGGGNGGSGCSGNNIGPGGAGGGGAGSGGTGGMSWSMAGNGNYYYIYGGHGGNGGNTYSASNYNLFDAGKTGKTDVKGGTYDARGGVGGNGYGSGVAKAAKNAVQTSNLTYNIKYNNVDESVTNKSYEVGENTKITLKDCTGCAWQLKTYGKTFGDSSTILNKNSDELLEGSTILDASKLYGELEFTAIPKKYNFTFNKNGGYGGDSSTECTYYAKIPKIEIPTRTGKFFFNGYWNEQSGERIFDASGNPTYEKCDFTEDMNLDACWETTKEVPDATVVDGSLTGDKKELAESAKEDLNVTVAGDDNQKHLEDYYTRPEGDTLSHHLYFKTTIKDVTSDNLNLDIKPVEQTVEHNVKQGAENELTVLDGNKYNLKIDLPDVLDVENGDVVFIRHIKEDGTVYYDEATVIRGKVTFVNTHGFSEFDVSTGEYGEDPQFSSKSLILGDKIGVSFYMDIPEEYQGGTMYFDISGKGGCTASSDGEYIKNNGQYKFVCYVNSLQMAGKITAKYVKELADGIEYKTIDEYSVVDYLTGEAVQLGTSKMKKLASKMYAYGYYAQQYLSRVKDSVKLGISADSYAPMTEPGAAPDLTKDLSSYKMEVSANGNTKLKDNPMISLSLDSEIGMKLYMELSGDSSYGSDNKPNVTIDGEAIDSSKITFGADGSGNAQMIIPVDNIQVSRLGHRFNVVVDDTYTIKASALAYANALKNQDDDFAKKLGAALYEYYEATMKYANLAIE